MANLSENDNRLSSVRFPSHISWHHGGRSLVATVQGGRGSDESPEGRIWRFDLDGAAVQLTHGPNGDYAPSFSPVDDRIAFASDRKTPNKSDLFILSGSAVRSVGSLPGTIEDLTWTSDGSALVVLAADPGLDDGGINGAKRIRWGGIEDPAVTNPTGARRRLYKVTASNGTTIEIGPRTSTVWEFDLFGDDGAVVLFSPDASERGWHHAKLAQLDFMTRELRVLHESRWQLQGPVVSPSGTKMAFLEGWASDRGAVAGEMRILDLADGHVRSLAANEQSSISALSWRTDDSLWFTGRSGLGSVYGVVRLDGTFEYNTREDAVLAEAIAPLPNNVGFAAIRETVGRPPEIVFKADAKSQWQPLTSLNAPIMDGFSDYAEVREVQWKGKDGLALEGLLLLPKTRQSGPLPTIVDIHGGPTLSARHSFNPGLALHAAAAGYAVFRVNYRGSSGWGQAYSQLIVGDPGGAEWDDIMAGVDHCIAEGVADADRLGVTGCSYGGYLTAWAVARTNRFKAAVMVAGISNLWSCHYSSNHDFVEYIVGGPLKEERFRKLAIDRSPLYCLDGPSTPTLIIHGELDRCTPLGQGQEFYSALLEHGVAAELVVYPREGHILAESEHRLDKVQRTLAWLDRHIRQSQ